MPDSPADVFELRRASRPGYRFSSERLRARRLELGLTQAALEGLSGVPRAHIARLELRRRRAAPAAQFALACALDVPVDELFPPEPTEANVNVAREHGKALRGARERSVAPVRLSLLELIGPCGSPSCDDPHCGVRERQCHEVGCERPAAIARQTSKAHRCVVGHPMKYCSGVSCSASVGLAEIPDAAAV